MLEENIQVRSELLLCRECGVLQPLGSDADDIAEVADREQFASHHTGHTIEPALRLAEPALHDRPAWDPMATAWYRVAVGESSFYVRSSRTSIDEPRRHELQLTPPELNVHVDLDEAVLLESLDRYFQPQKLSGDQAQSFLKAVLDLFAGLDPAQIETSFNDPALANAELGPCPDPVCDELLSTSAQIFPADWEQRKIARFIEENRSEYGALAIRVRRQVAEL
jgi:hypothetical protein